MIKREIEIEKLARKGKALLIMGPRRVGKTTSMKDFLEKSGATYKLFDGTMESARRNFSVNEFASLNRLVGTAEILAIDEAQYIENVGNSLKILTDHRPDLTVIATGSSSFDLLGQVGEPLVGRSKTCLMYPISVKEYLGDDYAKWQLERGQLLVYGMYPDVLTAKSDGERRDFLVELVNKLLLRDVLTFQEVKGSDVIFRLLQLLAFQVGSEVSIEELGNSLGISKNTVNRYIDLLKKAYILFELSGFSRNLRSEITKKSKYFFFDNGIRNALINNFNGIELRDDVGRLWENFALVERMKRREYSKIYANQYFWRTYSGNELDLVEERDGKLFGYEFKWAKTGEMPKEWREAYGAEAEFLSVNRDNFLDFVG
ncbi:MAG: ATP-binding protein [Candidatus Nomurabacteria bacterium]|jgi:predicted AAA+ superfamily ATPase|nr:ATP-binding protein [Candidatus Nomurabacteria bacterium]